MCICRIVFNELCAKYALYTLVGCPPSHIKSSFATVNERGPHPMYHQRIQVPKIEV